MNQAMPERLAVCFRGYICRGSPAAVKPESSSSTCLQVRESCGFNRGRFQIKSEMFGGDVTKLSLKEANKFVKSFAIYEEDFGGICQKKKKYLKRKFKIKEDKNE